MTQPEANPSLPEEAKLSSAAASTATETASGDADADAETEPQPEPWTPRRVTEWNAYYDIYVMLAALLLAFVVSAVRVDESNAILWAHLKTGEIMAQQGAPVTSDAFSYSATGERWVNIPWLFQWSHAALFKLVKSLIPADQNDQTANQAAAEQIGIGVLIGLNALARLLTAWILLRIRRPGPGLWWSAVCVALALGAIVGPFGVVPGGIAGPGIVSPSTWGLLLLAIEMLCLHRAYNEGRRRALYWLVPIFLLWANLDESFLMGLLILAGAACGRILDGRAAESLIQPAPIPELNDGAAIEARGLSRRPVGLSTGLVVLAMCIAVCLINPTTQWIFVAVTSPFQRLFGSQTEVFKIAETSFFGEQIRKQYPTSYQWLAVYYLIIVALGLISFLLNARRFSWSRFLPFAIAAAGWGTFRGFGQEFAAVFAAVAALNGQEWYQDRFGTEGRLGARWTIWSTGGRLVTLAVLFFCVGVAITGWRKSPEEPRFGFSYDPAEFPFEAADYLARREDITGNILNSTAAQGDALIWRAFPARRTFIDGRAHLFSDDLLEEHRQVRNAVRDDDTKVWKPAFDKYGISAVMIDSATAPRTYERLMQSGNWIPFYDDGRAVMFGRADASEPDLTTFKNNRLEPELRAYRVSAPVPSAERPPTPTTWIDDIFRNRLLGRAQPHTSSAVRWLQGGPAGDSNQATLPDPARCLLAIREARTALAKNPDDWVAYRLLEASYRVLMQQETAMLARIPLNAENAAKISTLVPSLDLLNTRFRQRVTALNYAIQTTPPPKTPESRREVQSLHLSLFQLFIQAGYVDMARDQLQSALDLLPSSEASNDAALQYRKQLDQLKQRCTQIEENMMDLQLERQAGPIEKAIFARGQGAIGLALGELEEAYRGSMSPVIVIPQLIELYNNTGQPDRALEILAAGGGDEPGLGTEPGASFLRQGQVYLLLGNYLSAASLWRERAIPRLRYDRSMRALTVAQVLGRGDLISAVNTDESIPTLVTRQGFWEFELAQCLLESGSPDQAAEYFTKALTHVPDLPVRPIIAYYLEKMGKPVPELPKKSEAPQVRPKSAVDAFFEGGKVLGPAKPVETPKPEPAKPAPKTEPTKGKL
jgi:tetratricopeptide (TPR) repeat protein